MTYEAPRFTYSEATPPGPCLLALVEVLRSDPAGILDAGADSETRERLGAYLAARDRLLHVGARVEPTDDPLALLDRAGQPLLSVVQESGDFLPAYNPLLALAVRLRGIDPERARRLLLDLEDAAPRRPEAREMRQRPFGG